MRIWTKRLLCLLAAGMLAGGLIAGAQEEQTHTAYLHGFPDGTIRPEDPLTREQLAAVLFRLMDDPPACTESFRFQDVVPGRWSFDAIAACCRLGIVLGGTDGCYRPEQAVTWREMVCVLDRITFSDGGCEQLEALAAGWCRAREKDPPVREGTQPVLRAELAVLFNLLLGRTLPDAEHALSDASPYADNRDTTRWFYLPVLEAGTDHTFCAMPGGERWTGAG